jgi:hypothetical protein
MPVTIKAVVHCSLGDRLLPLKADITFGFLTAAPERQHRAGRIAVVPKSSPVVSNVPQRPVGGLHAQTGESADGVDTPGHLFPSEAEDQVAMPQLQVCLVG